MNRIVLLLATATMVGCGSPADSPTTPPIDSTATIGAPTAVQVAPDTFRIVRPRRGG